MAANLGRVIRSFSTQRVLRASMAEPLQMSKPAGEHKDGHKKWKNIFYFVCVPAIILGTVNVMITEEEEPPEFKNYSHLRIRNKKFPWRDGVKTLFHNPHRNALPDGYEVDIHAKH